MTLRVYGDSGSGNCLKVKWVCDLLGVSYAWVEVDVLSGFTRTPAFLAINPAGQVPAVTLPDGRVLTQSNAIVEWLAEGSSLISADPFERARMREWMYWEQYSHEPYVAVRRFHLHYLKKRAEELDPKLFERGAAALERMEAALAGGPYLVGGALSLADVVLLAYTRMAGQGGFDLGLYPNLRGWIGRVERDLALEPLAEAA